LPSARISIMGRHLGGAENIRRPGRVRGWCGASPWRREDRRRTGVLSGMEQPYIVNGRTAAAGSLSGAAPPEARWAFRYPIVPPGMTPFFEKKTCTRRPVSAKRRLANARPNEPGKDRDCHLYFEVETLFRLFGGLRTERADRGPLQLPRTTIRNLDGTGWPRGAPAFDTRNRSPGPGRDCTPGQWPVHGHLPGRSRCGEKRAVKEAGNGRGRRTLVNPGARESTPRQRRDRVGGRAEKWSRVQTYMFADDGTMYIRARPQGPAGSGSSKKNWGPIDPKRNARLLGVRI